MVIRCVRQPFTRNNNAETEAKRRSMLRLLIFIFCAFVNFE